MVRVVARGAVVVAAVDRRRSRRALARGGVLDVEGDPLIGPARVALHLRALGGVRRIEVRIGPYPGSAVEAACGSEPGRVIRPGEGAEPGAGAYPRTETATFDDGNLARVGGEEVVSQPRVEVLDRDGRRFGGAQRPRQCG